MLRPGPQEHRGARGECRAGGDDIIDQDESLSLDRAPRSDGDRSGHVRRSFLGSEVDLCSCAANPQQILLNRDAQQLRCTLGKEKRLIESSMAQPGWVERHRHEGIEGAHALTNPRHQCP